MASVYDLCTGEMKRPGKEGRERRMERGEREGEGGRERKGGKKRGEVLTTPDDLYLIVE
jgi:hypothetical protein